MLHVKRRLPQTDSLNPFCPLPSRRYLACLFFPCFFFFCQSWSPAAFPSPPLPDGICSDFGSTRGKIQNPFRGKLFATFAAVCSAIDCYVCTYKDGSDTLPTVVGVTWQSEHSASSSVFCKDGEAKHTLSETCASNGDKCIVSFLVEISNTQNPRT